MSDSLLAESRATSRYEEIDLDKHTTDMVRRINERRGKIHLRAALCHEIIFEACSPTFISCPPKPSTMWWPYKQEYKLRNWWRIALKPLSGT
jgi:hypothetical protein